MRTERSKHPRATPFVQFARATACSLPLLAALAGCGEREAAAPVAPSPLRQLTQQKEPEPVGGPPLVRRLTEAQYRNTIADIFGADIAIAARFERGLRSEGLLAVGTSEAGISPFSIEQYDAAARGVADAVVGEERRGRFVPCNAPADGFDEACATRFIERFAPLLLRRSVQSDEIAHHVDTARSGQAQLGDFYGGLKYALVGLMMSPEFLLRVENVATDANADDVRQLDAFSKATRLSYFLINSTPDPELLQAAANGELDTRDGLARQVDRLLASPRFEDTVRAFFTDMLEFDLFDDLAKDPLIYPAFNSEVASHAQEQTLRTIVDLLLVQQRDYRELFTTRETWLTRPLGIVYRVPVPTRNGWEKVEFPVEEQRAGIQSHVSFLALHAHPGRSSPTLRGKAIREVFLCQEVPDPPPDVDFTLVLDPNVTLPTARDRLHRHNSDPACTGCHLITDPPGLTLERFDGLGTLRTHENGALIDTHGSLDGIEFDEPDRLGQALHDHPETPRCLVEKVYRYAVGRDTVWEERAYMDWLIGTFKRDGHRLPQLMRAIATSRNFFAVQPDDARGHASLNRNVNTGPNTHLNDNTDLNDNEGDRT